MTSATYARGVHGPTALGGFILLVCAALSTVLVVAGILYFPGEHARNQVALALAKCEPNLSPSGLGCVTEPVLAGEYKAITAPVFVQLNGDMAAYTATEHRNLAAAQAALSAEAASERALAQRLGKFPFPPMISATARTMMKNMLALATLTAQQASSSSLFQMRTFNQRVAAASAIVQTELGAINKGIHKLPTASEEP